MHYAIIGNGVAGVTAAFALRQREPKSSITLISGESEYFFSRTALMYSYMDKMEFKALEPFERKSYDKQNIRRVFDWVVNLDAGSRTLTLKSGGTLTYDKLLLATGSVANRIPWKGLEQVNEGLVNFVTLQDLQACERLTLDTRKAVVVGGGLIGIELVECLRYHGVDVTFLIREPWYWPVALDQEEAGIIAEHIRAHGVDLRLKEEVTEVHAQGGRVSAVTTSAGSSIACQMLGVTAGVRPAVDWLRNVATPPELGRGIVTDAGFATSLPNVYAAGDCAEIRRAGAEPLIEQIWYSAKRQGELAACAMLGDSIDYTPPVFYNSSKFFEIEYTTVGLVTKAPADATHFFHRIEGAPHASARIVSRGNAVIGFNMLGSRWNHTVFERWIAERRSPAEVVARLEQAQFDVEFGRAPLASLKSAFARQEGVN